ncbi:MAG TPA: TetR/AcrR family transcriptional regulator [Dehalococcoidia bacterium]|jgi:AcrR family transcriptional regulator
MRGEPTTLPDDSAQRDGRAERSERTRAAVVEALLSLIDEGVLRPTAPRIAERAGVSLRTVFHHYEDMEALFATAADMQLKRIMALAAPLPRDGALEDRIDALAMSRSRLHEAVSPVRRAALLVEHESPTIAERLRWVRDLGRRELARVFEIELAAREPTDRRELLEALTAATSWSCWEALRTHQGLTLPAARRAMARTVRALLTEDGR